MGKKKNLDLKGYDFQRELDIPDFPDFNFEPPKDDRKPITKVASGFAKGFKSTVASPSFIRKAVETALPKGYGASFEIFDKTQTGLKDLYNTVTKDAKPVATELKRTVGRMLPLGDKLLPKGWSEKMKRWSEDVDKTYRSGNYDPNEALLQQTMMEMQKAQMEESARQANLNDARTTIKDTVEQSRHRDSLGQLSSIREGIVQLTSYQNNVTANYQRKSLELQYRSYFVAVEALGEQKRVSGEMLNKLDLITKNTGLPEYVKLKTSERFGEAMRNKLIDGVNNSFFDQRRNFMKNFMGNVSKNVTAKTSGFLNNVRAGLGMTNTLLDAREQAEDVDRYDAAGNMAGNLAANTLGGRFGKWMRKKTERIPGFMRGANMSEHFANNLQQNTTEWARGDKGDYIPVIGGAIRSVKDAALSANRLNNTVQTDNLRTINEPMPYTRHANKSITEIIPGYLARILRELQITRTGDTSTEAIHYDYTKNKFDTATTVKKNAFKDIVDDTSRRYNTEDIESLVKRIDPANKLSEEQRKILGRKMLQDNLSNKTSSASRLSKRNAWNGPETAAHADAFANVMKEFFDGDTDKSKQAEFSKRYTSLGRYSSQSNSQIQHHINSGLYEFLQEAGIIKEGDQIDQEKMNQYWHDGQYTPGSTNAPPGGPLPFGPPSPFGPGGPPAPGGKKKKKKTPTPTPVPFGPPAPPPGWLPTSPTFDDTRIIEEIKETRVEAIKVINETSVKPLSEMILEVIQRMDKRLEEGIRTFNMNDPGNPGGGPGPAPGPGGGGSGGRWWNPTVGGLFKGIGKVGWKAGKGVWKASNFVARGINKGVMGTLKMGLGGLRRGSDMITGLRDVFVPGEDEPRLLAWKLKAGHYVNKADGKTIHSIRDITGAVLDENGDEVLSDKEAKKAYVKGFYGKKLITGMGAVIKGVWGAAKNIVRVVPAAVGLALRTAAWAGKKLFGLLDRPQDVYVRGQRDPVLLKVTMAAGGYFSERTGEPIMKVSDIDGAVVDHDGDIVLSRKMLAGGLYDKKGKPIKTGFSKLFSSAWGLTKGVAKLGGKVVKGVYDGAKAIVGGIGSLVGGAWKGLVGKNGIMFAGSKNIIDHLIEIRDILDKRLPGKKVQGDLSGDGIRDGSVEDLRLKRKEKEEAKDKKKKEKADADAAKAAGGGGILAGLKGIFDKFKGKDKDDDEDDIDGKDMLNAAGDAWGQQGDGKDGKKRRRRRGGRGRGPRPPASPPRAPGWKGKLGRGAKTVGRGAMKGLGFLGRGAMGLAGLGGLTSMAGGALGTAAGAVGTVAAGAGSAIMGAAGVVGTAIAGLASVIGAPILLGAAAVAAIGVGGYYAYKYFTKNDLTPLSTMRYTQYGFVARDPKHVSVVFGLEEKLKDAITYSGSGLAQINEKKLDIKKLVEDFGVEINNPRDREKWVRWFANRFKPLFIVHMTVLNKVKKGAKLSDIDKMTNIEKKQYIDGAKFPGGPYDEMTSPIPGQDNLPATSDDVSKAITAAYEAVAKDEKAPKKLGGKIDEALKAKTDAALGLGGAAAAAAAAKAKAPTALKDTMKSKSDYTKIDDKGFEKGRGELYVAAGAVPFAQTRNGQIDGLTALRFKTYGLVEMEADKVRALAVLEKQCQTGVSFGANKKAAWRGDPDTLLMSLGPMFGVSEPLGDQGRNWLGWFSGRFLPAYLNYATGVFSAVGKSPSEDITLTPASEVEIASMIVATSSVQDGTPKSVFLWAVSPWDGYVLNSDMASTDANMQGLKNKAKSVILPDKVGQERKRNADGSFVTDSSGKVQTGAGSARPSSVFEKLFGTEATDKQQGTGIRGAVGRFFGAGPTVGNAASGNAIVQPGNGTGGDINSLPMPTGNGTYESVKDLLNAVAAMTGTDPKLMATMAAVESDFNWKVKAGTSSATGLYQFTSGTWSDMMKKYAKKYGIDPRTPPTDPRANALMGAEFLKENANALKGVKTELTDTDLYLAHFLGAGGAKQFLRSRQDDIAATSMSSAANANKAIFYDPSGRPRTFAETYAEINRRVQSKGKKFGLGSAEVGAKGTGAEAIKAAAAAKTDAGKAAAPAAPPTAMPPVALGGPDTSAAGLGAKPSGPAKQLDMDMTAGLPQKANAAAAGLGGSYAKSVVGSSEPPAEVLSAAYASRSRVANAQAQAKVQAAVVDPVFTEMGSVMKESLDNHKKAVDLLGKILTTLQTGQKTTATMAEAISNIKPPVPEKKAKPAPTAPVSVAKPL